MSTAAGVAPLESAGASPAPSEVFIARQPILDRRQMVYGYELLFRSGVDSVFSCADPDQASAKVMTDSALVLRMAEISGAKRAFISITRNILLKEYMHFLPSDLTAAEIPATLGQDPEVVCACRKLKEAGYLLVLDDFIFRDQHEALIELADIVKVDFPATPVENRREIPSRLRRADLHFLAKKVETREQFQQAVDMGYSYFQGYFLSKPVILSARDVPGYKLNYLRMLQEIQSPGLQFDRLEQIIKRDMALSFKLLRYINSSYFGLTNKVTSILHAMMLLGPKELKQWASLLILAGLGDDKPDELVVQGLIRGRLCELLAPRLGMRNQSQPMFLLGMFSLLDAILGRPMEKILEDLPLTPEFNAALLGTPNRPRIVLDYAVAYERGVWEKLLDITGVLGFDESGVPLLYRDAVRWAEQSFEEIRAAG
jgi:c-di-GMP-related signal transduction protein